MVHGRFQGKRPRADLVLPGGWCRVGHAGAVQCQRRDGGVLKAVFCDAFTMRNDKITRLVTYQAELK